MLSFHSWITKGQNRHTVELGSALVFSHALYANLNLIEKKKLIEIDISRRFIRKTVNG